MPFLLSLSLRGAVSLLHLLKGTTNTFSIFPLFLCPVTVMGDVSRGGMQLGGIGGHGMAFIQTVQSAVVEHKVEGLEWCLFTYPLWSPPLLALLWKFFVFHGCPFLFHQHWRSIFLLLLLSSSFPACTRHEFVFLNQVLPKLYIACCTLRALCILFKYHV